MQRGSFPKLFSWVHESDSHAHRRRRGICLHRFPVLALFAIPSKMALVEFAAEPRWFLPVLLFLLHRNRAYLQKIAEHLSNCFLAPLSRRLGKVSCFSGPVLRYSLEVNESKATRLRSNASEICGVLHPKEDEEWGMLWGSGFANRTRELTAKFTCLNKKHKCRSFECKSIQ